MNIDSLRDFDFYGLAVDSACFSSVPVPHAQIRATDASRAPFCPKCGAAAVNRKGKTKLLLRDVPIEGVPVVVEIALHSHRCRKCAASFIGGKPYQDGKNHFTPRLRQWVLDHAGMKRLELAALTGVCERSIKGILKPISQPQG